MKRTNKVITALLLATLILSMTGCGNSRKSETTHSDRNDIEYTEAVAPETRGAAYDSAYEASDCEIDYEESYDYVETEDASFNGTTSGSYDNTSYSFPEEQMLIRYVYLNVETSNFIDVTDSIKATMRTLGGYVESSYVTGTGNEGSLRYGTYVLRIPSENMDAMLDSIGTNCVVVSESEETEDVTLQYSDIESHITALRSEQSTLLELLDETDSVDYIITLEQRLSEISYEIESYESAARVLSNLTSYSTLTINVQEVIVEVEPERPEPPKEEPTLGEEIKEKISNSWSSVKKDFRRNFVNLISNAPYLLENIVILILTLLPFGIIALVIVIIVKKNMKKAAKKKANQVENKPQDKTEDKK